MEIWWDQATNDQVNLCLTAWDATARKFVTLTTTLLVATNFPPTGWQVLSVTNRPPFVVWPTNAGQCFFRARWSWQ